MSVTAKNLFNPAAKKYLDRRVFIWLSVTLSSPL